MNANLTFYAAIKRHGDVHQRKYKFTALRGFFFFLLNFDSKITNY